VGTLKVYMYMCIYMYTCMYTYIKYVSIYVYIYLHLYMYIYIYIYIYMYIHTNEYTYMHAYLHIYIDVSISGGEPVVSILLSKSEFDKSEKNPWTYGSNTATTLKGIVYIYMFTHICLYIQILFCMYK
jgi:hypothetical protein